MKKGRIIFLIAGIAGMILACDPIENENEDTDNTHANDTSSTNNVTGNNGTSSNDWLIPRSDVFDGGPGKDGIPALEDPHLVTVEGADYLEDTSLVIGIVIGDKVRAYPHLILDWHEIINDEIEGEYFAIIYCPLTGTGMAWDRELSIGLTSFGVSGLLYNTNIIPYDRISDSNWSQIRLDCVGGELTGEKANLLTVVETTWQTWKEIYPESEVVSTRTGYSRRYGFFPYGDYITNHDYLIFPVSNTDARIPNKERVHGVIHSSGTYIYRFDKFYGATKLYDEMIGDQRVVIVGDKSKNFIKSFFSDEGSKVIYSAVEGQLPIVFEDNEGNKYDLFGEVHAGPKIGKRLKSTDSFMGYWFSWAAFYPHLEIR